MDKNFTVKYITKGYTKSGGRWMRTRIYEGTSLRCEEEWRYEGEWRLTELLIGKRGEDGLERMVGNGKELQEMLERVWNTGSELDAKKPVVAPDRRADFFSALLGFVSVGLEANNGVLLDAMEAGALGDDGKNFAEFIRENPGNQSLWKRPTEE